MSFKLFNDFDALNAVEEIEREGAVSLGGFLKEKPRNLLLEELGCYIFKDRPRYHGEYNTEQNFRAVDDFAPEGLFVDIRFALEEYLRVKFEGCPENPLSKPLQFNELVVQRYAPGPLGITPHKDLLRCINVIVILVLEGQAEFCLCDDREGNNPRALKNEPGDLLLMRGAHFGGQTIRPFHTVKNIRSQRTTYGLRQKK